MMQLTRRSTLGVNAVATHDNMTIAPRITCLERAKKLCVRVLSFFKTSKRAIFMEDYEVITYFLLSEHFQNEVSCKNGFIFCQLIGSPSKEQIKKTMEPTKRDFALDGNLVIVKLESEYKTA